MDLHELNGKYHKDKEIFLFLIRYIKDKYEEYSVSFDCNNSYFAVGVDGVHFGPVFGIGYHLKIGNKCNEYQCYI